VNILGYAGLNHDPSIAVLSGPRIRCAIESEKVTRQKHEINVFPERAMRFALDVAGLSLEDIDVIALNYDARPLSNRLYLPHLLRFLRTGNFDVDILSNLIVLAASHSPRVFRRLNEYRIPRIVPVAHHLAHLGSAYPFSPFEEAAVAVIDASGELACTSLYTCAGRRFRKLYSMDLPNDSLGTVYMLATVHLGYRMIGDEYKVMGLAAYGGPNDKFRRFFENLIQLQEGGRYRVDGSVAGSVFSNGWKFPEAVARSIGARRRPGEEFTQEHKDFAFELQRRLEEALLHVLRHVRKITGLKHLCMAGGVALNSVANGKILEHAGFEEVFIQPAASDAGTSLGAAAFHHYFREQGERPEPMEHVSLGPRYSDEQIEGELGRCKQTYRRVTSPSARAAELLASGNVIGWFQGATEFGPRALGCRSILADPRRPEMKEKVNRLIKERESYRPFAPSILEEAAAEFFESIRRSPFMLLVGRVREERRGAIPAVVHVDGTARLHTVDRRTNPLYHELIEAFRKLTGVPVVLNTSFNVAGEPIVNSPLDALRCFHASGLDALVMGNCVVEKRPEGRQHESEVSTPGRAGRARHDIRI
jgi:carbamoyltransferase